MATKPTKSNGKNGHKNGHVDDTAISIPALEATPVAGLSPEVADSLRYTISRLSRDGELPPRLALVAALRGEGVTFLTRALGALIAGDQAKKVCVVELNWRWPAPAIYPDGYLPTAADLARRPRLAVKALELTGSLNPVILEAGFLVPDYRAAAARSTELSKALEMLGKQFDHVILDVPAILATSDSVPLAELANRCCLVVRHGVTSVEQANRALDEIRHLYVEGVIFNQTKLATPSRILNLVSPR